jgi:hypothetical protein
LKQNNFEDCGDGCSSPHHYDNNFNDDDYDEEEDDDVDLDGENCDEDS